MKKQYLSSAGLRKVLQSLREKLDNKFRREVDRVDEMITEDRLNLENLQEGKAEKVHSHVVSDMDGLQTILDKKSDANHNHDTVYAPMVHTHGLADITDLESYVDERIGVIAGSTLDEINGEVI